MSIPVGGASSFAGLTFYIQQNQFFARPWVDRRERRTITPVPYSDDAIIQLGGRDPWTLTLTVVIPASQVNTFLSKRKSTGTLSLLGGDSVTALLLDVTNILDSNTFGFAQLSATWVGV